MKARLPHCSKLVLHCCFRNVCACSPRHEWAAMAHACCRYIQSFEAGTSHTPSKVLCLLKSLWHITCYCNASSIEAPARQHAVPERGAICTHGLLDTQWQKLRTGCVQASGKATAATNNALPIAYVQGYVHHWHAVPLALLQASRAALRRAPPA